MLKVVEKKRFVLPDLGHEKVMVLTEGGRGGEVELSEEIM